MCTRIDCQVISSRYSLATFQSPSWHLFHPLTKHRGQYFGERFGRPSKNSFIKLKRNDIYLFFCVVRERGRGLKYVQKHTLKRTKVLNNFSDKT